MAEPARELEPERSPAIRILAERALVALLTAIEEPEPQIIVLGGLVPEVLVGGQEPPPPTHLGTTDVDILLVSHLTADAPQGHVEAALRKIEFRPADGGWRWRGSVEGVPIKIEFLCDLADRPEYELVRLAGCEALVANNLRGTGYVAEDWSWETLHASRPDGGTATVRARFAGLSGYLLSKVVAVRTRAATKDFYDLVYVLLHNRAGGPASAARSLLTGKLGNAVPALRPTLVEVRERYRMPNAVGPSGYAEQCLQLDPELDERELRADAVAAIAEFVVALLDERAGG